MERIRVVLADDQEPMRAGLRLLLSMDAEIEVVAEARNGREAYDLAVSASPHVIVMDLDMPVENGADATRRIVADGLAARVVVLSSEKAQDAELLATRIGAAAFVSKDFIFQRLVGAIKAAAQISRSAT